MKAEELSERLFVNSIGMLELLSQYLGEQLGLYRNMTGAGWLTAGELAERTGTYPRYVREWLEYQAVSELVEVEDAAADPHARRYRLPDEHAEVLVNTDSLLYGGFKATMLVRAVRPLPALVEAFRSGAGLDPVPWAPEGRPEFNRAIFIHLLGTEWLPAIPEIDGRLRADPPARIADLGCGTGWSSIAMARAYPNVLVDGFDLDEDAIAVAKGLAQAEGVADRVRFEVRDVSSMEGAGPYDLVTVIEALHDMSRPVEALAAVRPLLAADGAVLVADEPVAERFTIPASETDRYVYGWSVVSCLPMAMGDPDSAATGAAMRPDTLRRYADAAGYGTVDVLFENDYWRFYLLRP